MNARHQYQNQTEKAHLPEGVGFDMTSESNLLSIRGFIQPALNAELFPVVRGAIIKTNNVRNSKPRWEDTKWTFKATMPGSKTNRHTRVKLL